MVGYQVTLRDQYDFKIFMFIKDDIQHIAFNVAKDLYYKQELSKHGTLSIIEFLNELGKESDCPVPDDIQNFKFSFNSNLEDRYIDITKCNSIIKILKNSTDTFADQQGKGSVIPENINKITNIRNKVSKIFLEIEELEKYKDELIDLAASICKSMGPFYESKYQGSIEIQEKYKQLEKESILNINTQWKHDLRNDGPRFMDEILNERNVKFQKFVSECHQELIDEYKTQNELSPLLQEQFKFKIDAVFVPPLLKDKDESISYKDILHRKLSGQETEPSIVIISADAGHGKTTICRKLTLEWCISGSKIPYCNYDLLLLIEVKRATENGICQYLTEILLKNSLLKINASDKEIILFLQQLKLLIIIDAFDEKSEEAQHLINSLFKFLPDKKIIITTRPHYVNQIGRTLKEKNLQYLVVKLEGFKDEKDYIEKVWSHLKKEVQEFQMNIDNFFSFIKDLPEDFKKLIRIPLIIFLLIYLWVNSKKPIKNLTFTSLYKQVFDLQKETIEKKILQNTNEKNPLHLIQMVINSFFSELSKKCYTQLTKTKEMNSNCIEEMQLYLVKELKKHQMDSEYVNIFMSTIFMCSWNIRNIRDKSIVQYEFLHKTQFEYFVAYHASDILVNHDESSNLGSVKDLEIFNETNFNNNEDEFSFLLGILNEEGKLKNFVESIIDIIAEKGSNYNTLWKFLSQTISDHSKTESVNDFKANSELCKYYKDKILPNLCWELKDEDVISGLSILCYTYFKPGQLIINLDNNPNKISSFEQKFSEMINTLNQCKKRAKPTSLELYFKNHKKKSDDKSEDRSSDNILAHLNVGRFLSMEKFAGHIEKNETVQVFDISMDLIRIDVRVTSIQVLQTLVTACNNKKTELKKMYIIFDEPFKDKMINKLKKLNIKSKKTDICVIYNSVSDINLAIDNLTRMKPQDRMFYSLQLDLIMPLDQSPKNWLLKIQKLIEKELTVKSSYKMEGKEQKELAEELSYLLKWNK